MNLNSTRALGIAVVTAVFVSAAVAGISQLPAPPESKIKNNVFPELEYTLATKEMRIARPGVIATGYMPQTVNRERKGDNAYALSDREAAGDMADAEEAASKNRLAAAEQK